MPNGEVVFKTFKSIQQAPLEPRTPLDLPESSLFDCCDEYLVLNYVNTVDY